ncbi:unnamed protein product [Cylindrotheca closterium]|uniref:tRNA/rRNA methyltransferase SpoU type domain-containing protein n=1 Tax=Cylindrotheca closterium TaxID=2856 RepID=A0AAD2FVZ3_9STRA|nr:unnamed protein product [Cylindrotheca closterium]
MMSTSGRVFHVCILLFMLLAKGVRGFTARAVVLRSGTGGLFPQTLLFSSTPGSSSDDDSSRVELLNLKLKLIGVDSQALKDASLASIQDPTQGYDGSFGKSAIKTYRAFCFKNSSDTDDPIQLSAQAGRVAQQVDFLIKRHKSHQTEWVRHHDALQQRRQVFPLFLLLDNLRSAFNVGSIFRTADACGCQAVYTTGITPHPNGSGADKVQKSALGAESVIESRHFATTQQAIESLRNEYPDLKILGMETTDKSEVYTNLDYMKYRETGVALVLGNEVTGVDTEIMSKLDAIVEIPTFGAKNSLNVAACAPVVLFEILRQWKV